MIRKLLMILIGLVTFFISFIAVVLPWDLRFVYTKKVCSKLHAFAKNYRVLGSLIKRTVEDHGLDMGGKDEKE